MTTLDKLVKTVESLKLYQSPSNLALDANMGKKEKITHCMTVSEYLSVPSTKTSADLTKLLSTAVDMFFTLLDDQDADVRMAADEHLNKVIRNLPESHISRMQVELYKEIKKNGSTRCLRTAWTKFADLSPQIRLQKCRPYVINLLPLITKTIKRREENVHETLLECIPKIFAVLVHYMTEIEIKNLIQAFIPNLFDASPVIRRATAVNVASICVSNRQATFFIPWAIDQILSLVFPLADSVTRVIYDEGISNSVNMSQTDLETGTNLLLGALGSCRILFSHLSEVKGDLQDASLIDNRTLQLYELSLALLPHTNITLVSVALEFLKQLLKSIPTQQTKRTLLSTDGLMYSRIFPQDGTVAIFSNDSPPKPRPSFGDSMDLGVEDFDSELSLAPLVFQRGQMQIVDSQDIPITPITTTSFTLEAAETTFFTETTPTTNIKKNVLKVKFPRKISGKIGNIFDKDIPLIYCARKITALFLLPDEKGDLIPDSCVRVSIKVLATDCLASVISLLPKISQLTLYSDQDETDILTPLIRDVANYTQHEDCQLRGAVAQLLGKILRGALVESCDNLTAWFEHRRPDFQDIVNIVQQLVTEDSSSITIRLALSSARSFLRLLLQSRQGRIALPLLVDLCTLVNAKYWLVKVELCSIISDIPFMSVYNITGKSDSQEICLKVLIKFVGDQDQRVREAAAKAFGEMIPNLYFPMDHPEDDCVTVGAIKLADSLLNPIIGANNLKQKDAEGEEKNFCDETISCSIENEESKWHSPVVFRVVQLLQRELISSSNSWTTLGCYEALLKVAASYPPVFLPRGWGCNIPRMRKMSTTFLNGSGINKSFPNPGFELLVWSVKSLTVGTISNDLNVHGKLLTLCGKVYAGLSMELLRTPTSGSSGLDSASASDANYLSAAISHEERLHQTAGDIISHVLKLLSILSHIIEDNPVVVPPPKSANIPGSSNSTLSPLKRKSSSTSLSGATDPTSKSSTQNQQSNQGQPPEASKRLGYFAHLSHYIRLYEILKAVNCNTHDPGKMFNFLRSCLTCLSSVLEFSLANTVGKHAEELLQYIRVVFNLDPLGTLSCVQSLLRSIFRTSIANAQSTFQPTFGMTFGQSGLYHVCFDQPYNELVHTFHLARDSTSTPDRGQSVLFNNKSTSTVKQSGSNVTSQIGKSTDRAMLSSYIRLFEPIVIKALKHYTLSSNPFQQTQVLRLLIQLVQLRVNYCLLDSDKIFVNFIMKQLESIEESHLTNVYIIIPDIFKFLVLLSYEKHHSKKIIDIPRILQLCEGLSASGHSPELFVTPALIPLAEELFCKKPNFTEHHSGSDPVSELEAQREVLLTMLMKSIHLPEVIDLLIRIMASIKTESEERWKKISRTFTDAMISQLAQQKIPLDDKPTLDLLRRFFAALAPSTLRPVDPLLSSVLTCEIEPSSSRDVTRWLGFIVTTLPILTHQSPEEAILRRLVELGIRMEVSGSRHGSFCRSFSPVLYQDGMASSSSQMDTSMDSSLSDDFQIPPETVIAKFLFQVIGVATSKLHQLIFSEGLNTASTFFLQQELSHLLLFIIYMFQSGRYYKVTKSAREIAKKGSKEELLYSLDLITDLFIQIGSSSPFLTLQWCYILKLIHFTSQQLWTRVIKTNGSRAEESVSLNSEILRRGGTILLCDYLCENITNVEQVTWLIVNHVVSVVKNIFENPVQEFVRLVHTSAPSSGLLLQAIISRVSSSSNVSFLRETFTAIEYVHATHSGKLINFLVNRFLVSPHLSLAQAAHALACSRMEHLLSVHREEAALQLSQEDLAAILETLRTKKLINRFSRLVKLLNTMSARLYEMSPIDADDGRIFCPGSLSSVTVNGDWLKSQIRSLCFVQANRNKGYFPAADHEKVCAKVLASLEDQSDILEIMSQKDFDVSILSTCISQTKSTSLSETAEAVLFGHIASILELVPKPLGIFQPVCSRATPNDQRYSDRLESLFSLDHFRTDFSKILPAYLSLVEKNRDKDFDQDSEFPFQNLARIAVLAMDFSKWLYLNTGSDDLVTGYENLICMSLKACNEALNWPRVLNQLDAISATSIAITLADIVENRFPVSSSQVMICAGFKDLFERGKETSTMTASIKLNEMFSDLIRSSDILVCREEKMPREWFQAYKVITINLCRLEYFTSYVRIPPELWRMKWDPEVTGQEGTTFPQIPMDYLQEVDILKQYILRVGLLGWNSRNQFEETWTTLLSIFSISKDDFSDEEVQALSPCSVLAVQSITDMLLQTMWLPQPGHRARSKVVHVPRAAPHKFYTTKRGLQLLDVLEIIKAQTKESGKISNLERCNRTPNEISQFYGFGQVSVEYLRNVVKFNIENEDVNTLNLPPPIQTQKSCLDIKSCLRFLFELYTQWLTISDIPLQLLTETIRSMILLSDLFYEEAHFRWLLDSIESIQKVHPAEDDILTSLLRVGVAKAVAVLGHCEPDIFERLKMSMESGFKSSHLPARMSTLHGILYLLQCDGQLGRDVTTHLIPLTIEYLKKYMIHTSMTTDVCHSEDHIALMWATTFYILDEKHDLVDLDSSTTLLNLAINETTKATSSTSRGLYFTLLNGLTRLVIAYSHISDKGNTVSENFERKMIKLATDLLTESNPVLVVPALKLFLTCMYTAKETSAKSTTEEMQDEAELLMQAMERMSILFDCVRRLGSVEAGLVCQILPKVLIDFFPAADVVNRVINEFISPGQPHQVLMAGVLYVLYTHASEQGHLSMLQDWILSSLPSFTHRSPISHSIWCLTIFFICAATSTPHLQAFFPYVEQKYGHSHHDDKKFFCLSAKTFYESLDKSQKKVFIKSFKDVALPKTPFYDVLVALHETN